MAPTTIEALNASVDEPNKWWEEYISQVVLALDQDLIRSIPDTADALEFWNGTFTSLSTALMQAAVRNNANDDETTTIWKSLAKETAAGLTKMVDAVPKHMVVQDWRDHASELRTTLYTALSAHGNYQPPPSDEEDTGGGTGDDSGGGGGGGGTGDDSGGGNTTDLTELQTIVEVASRTAERQRLFEQSAERRALDMYRVWLYLFLGALGLAVCALGAWATGGLFMAVWATLAWAVVAVAGYNAWIRYQKTRDRDPGNYDQVNPAKLVSVKDLALTQHTGSGSGGSGSGGSGSGGTCHGYQCCDSAKTSWSVSQNLCIVPGKTDATIVNPTVGGDCTGKECCVSPTTTWSDSLQKCTVPAPSSTAPFTAKMVVGFASSSATTSGAADANKLRQDRKASKKSSRPVVVVAVGAQRRNAPIESVAPDPKKARVGDGAVAPNSVSNPYAKALGQGFANTRKSWLGYE